MKLTLTFQATVTVILSDDYADDDPIAEIVKHAQTEAERKLKNLPMSANMHTNGITVSETDLQNIVMRPD